MTTDKSFTIYNDTINGVLFIKLIGLSGVKFGLLSYERLTKSADCEAGARFVNYKCDNRHNWTIRSSVMN